MFYSNFQYFINYINVPNALEEVPLVQLSLLLDYKTISQSSKG